MTNSKVIVQNTISNTWPPNKMWCSDGYERSVTDKSAASGKLYTHLQGPLVPSWHQENSDAHNYEVLKTRVTTVPYKVKPEQFHTCYMAKKYLGYYLLKNGLNTEPPPPLDYSINIRLGREQDYIKRDL